MELRSSLLTTIDKFKITGKELSQASGLTEAQISGFRNGKREIELKNFEKLVSSLPPDAYHHFWCQLAQDAPGSEQCFSSQIAGSSLKSDWRSLIMSATPQDIEEILRLLADRWAVNQKRESTDRSSAALAV